MDPERLRRIDQIIDEALDLPPDEQEAHAQSACGDDAELLQEVMEMLAMDSATDESFLEKPLVRWDLGPMSEGESLGPYRIVRLLGEGGMGQVYLAHQTEPFERDVALKLIKLSGDRKRLMRRFKREQTTLARLSHPYIAQVYDAGVSQSGNPFFAMEYIDGVPVTQYCKEQELDLQTRLELFISLCDGVQYAHQCGIIHRDIKPANMLVTLKEGVAVPKIIDFGIAKLKDAEEIEALSEVTDAIVTTSLTQTGLVMGSLGFMSPEQTDLAHHDVDTRTDIYSLGVVLYELLTGRRPLDDQIHRDMGYDEALRVIREQTLSPPADSVTQGMSITQGKFASPERLAKMIRGDLNAITMKALARDKDERYSSAAAFGNDIRRYLNGEPIAARPHSWSYIFSRWVARHKVAFGAAVTVSLTIFIGTFLAVTGFIRAREAKINSDQTLVILKDFLSSADPTKDGKDIKMVDLLEKFPERIEPDTRPEVLANIYEILGDTYASLGEPNEAVEMFELATKAHITTGKPESESALTCRIKEGYHLFSIGKVKEGEDILRGIIDDLKKKHGSDHPLVITASQKLGVILSRANRSKEAVEILEETLKHTIKRYGEDSTETNEIRHGLGASYARLGSLEKAQRELESVYQWHLKHNGRLHPATIRARQDLAFHAFRSNSGAFSIDDLKELVQDARQVLGEAHPATININVVLGGILYNQYRFEEAAEVFTETAKANEKLYGADHTRTLSSMSNLVATLFKIGKTQEAIEQSKKAVENCTKALGAEAHNTLLWKGNLGFMLWKSGQLEEAYQTMQEVLVVGRKIWIHTSIEFRNPLANLTIIALDLNRAEKGLAWAEENMQLIEKSEGVDDEERVQGKFLLARAWSMNGQTDRALGLFKETLKAYNKAFGPEKEEYALYVNWYATALRKAGRNDEAETLEKTVPVPQPE